MSFHHIKCAVTGGTAGNNPRWHKTTIGCQLPVQNIFYIARVDPSTGSSCTHFPVTALVLEEWGGPAAGSAYKW